jgi:dUTP pyrophosphatase
MQIKVKKLHPDAVIPSYAHAGDSGFDLVAVEDVIVTPGQTVKVRTGLAFDIPSGYELQVRPRSGVSAKTKLRVSNTPGTVDASYRGEVMVLVDNISLPEYVVDENDHFVTKNLTAYPIRIDGKLDEPSRVNLYPVGTYIIRKGDRICQGVIVPVIRVDIIEADELSDTVRGADGFGSTGTRAK